MPLEVPTEARIWLALLFTTKELKGYIETPLDVDYQISFPFFITWKRKGISIHAIKLTFSVCTTFSCRE